MPSSGAWISSTMLGIAMFTMVRPSSVRNVPRAKTARTAHGLILFAVFMSPPVLELACTAHYLHGADIDCIRCYSGGVKRGGKAIGPHPRDRRRHPGRADAERLPLERDRRATRRHLQRARGARHA